MTVCIKDYGYIYLRDHESYKSYNLIKAGKTNDLISRACTYITGEIKRGIYIAIYKVSNNILDTIDNHIKEEFEHYNKYYGAGTEFYHTNIIDEIEEFFIKYNYKYEKLSLSNINEIELYITKNITKCIKYDNNKYTPREDQIKIINKCINHFKYNNKGLLVLCCGFGKTIVSLLLMKQLNINKFLVLVPSSILVDQWIKKIKQIFLNKEVHQYKNNIDKFDILVTTYHNSKNLKNDKYIFDFIILDECHHLTSINYKNNNNANFIQALNLNTKYQLALTATCKKIKNKGNNVIDNFNTEFFGDIIDNINIKYGIENNIITDFQIQLMILNNNQIDYEINILETFNNKKLYMSAFIALNNLKLEISNNILIYANTIENAHIIYNYIDLFIINKIFLFNNDLKYLCYTSKNKNDITIIDDYKLSILISVYALGEGFDMPKLDTVLFSENMTSEIRIIQAALRPCRNYFSKNKAKIILPMICDNYIAHSDEFKKIRKTILAMINGDENYEAYMITKINILYYKKTKDSKLYNLESENISNDLIIKCLNNIILSKNDFKKLEISNNFLNHEFSFSKILLIKIENISDITNLAYSSIIKKLYMYINDADKILNNTSLTKGVLNYNKHSDKKVYYIENLNLFMRGIDSNTAVKEILCITKNLNINIELQIELSNKYNNKVIYYP